jgi:hypothetical protein
MKIGEDELQEGNNDSFFHVQEEGERERMTMEID